MSRSGRWLWKSGLDQLETSCLQVVGDSVEHMQAFSWGGGGGVGQVSGVRKTTASGTGASHTETQAGICGHTGREQKGRRGCTAHPRANGDAGGRAPRSWPRH